jgi:hypothetical protein
MTDTITLSRKRASEIVKAVKGIGELLKTLPARRENAAVMYGIMSNLAVIQTGLAGAPRASSN